ncbi:MAG: hypothetical protein ACRDBG_09875 [Waterburya sp.]
MTFNFLSPKQRLEIKNRKDARDIANGFCELPTYCYAEMLAWKYSYTGDWQNPPAGSATTIRYAFFEDYKDRLVFTVVENGSTGHESFYLSDIFTDFENSLEYLPLCLGSQKYQTLLVSRKALRELCRRTLEAYVNEGIVTPEHLQSWGLTIRQ